MEGGLFLIKRAYCPHHFRAGFCWGFLAGGAGLGGLVTSWVSVPRVTGAPEAWKFQMLLLPQACDKEPVGTEGCY